MLYYISKNYHYLLNINHIKVYTLNIYHNCINIQVNLVYKIPINYQLINHFKYITNLYDHLFKLNILQILMSDFIFY